tara:strand:+ start:18807 stop:19694 length:888 start_codon:yes stop_codon:yes gene_type:complete
MHSPTENSQNNDISYCRTLNELCQYHKFDIDYKYVYLDGLSHNPTYLCTIYIIENKSIIFEIETTGIGKKKSKNNAAKLCLNSHCLFKYLMKYKNKHEDTNNDTDFLNNNYIVWGKSIIEYQYTIYINDLNSLELFNNNTHIAVDSEGFSPKHIGLLPKIIQIANDNIISIFDYNRFYSFLKTFLKNKTIILCDAKSDLTQLKLSNQNYVDIQHEYFLITKENISLKRMASIYAGIPFIKPKGHFYKYELWDIDNIDEAHLIYAATDAFITFQIYTNIIKHKKLNYTHNLQDQSN